MNGKEGTRKVHEGDKEFMNGAVERWKGLLRRKFEVRDGGCRLRRCER